eukprot:GEMP01015951.1.p1 GENE.GEMP01015951.1~~GEMP01015951.1.p1  ORF type:complete len:353 (+),score=70.99 GEMP01015951.1:140-1198(+)
MEAQMMQQQTQHNPDQVQVPEEYDDDEDVITWHAIEKLQNSGINVADVKKLKDAGFNTMQSVMGTMRKELLAIKGLSDQKIEKIIEASRRTTDSGFMTCSQFVEKIKIRFRLSTGASNLDTLLGGGIESCSITELFGEFRCGKTQICHALSVIAQLPSNMGGHNGKVLYIDTEGTFRPERIRQIAESRQIPANVVMDNILYARCYTSEHLVQLLVEAIGHMVQSADKFALIVVDSIMGIFRVDYSGRGELSERQQCLGRVMSKLQKLSEEFNIAVVITNQVMADPSGGAVSFMPAMPKPVGGHVLAHMSTTRLSLRKGRGEQRVCKLYDSPSLPEADCIFEICLGGVRNATE